MRGIAASLGPEDRFDFCDVGGERASDASLWAFEVIGLRQWQEKMGNRGLNAPAFSWSLVTPDAFAKLFFNDAQRLKAVYGQAGCTVNLSPTVPEENDSTEYWISQLMPGLDVGKPTSTSVRDRKRKIKSVNWLTAIDKSMLDAVGGVSTLRSELPPSWFSIGDYCAGIAVRACVLPESGVSDSEDTPPLDEANALPNPL